MPQELVTVSGADGAKMLTVNGLHSALIQCFDQWLLPSELGGLDWAKAGEIITTPSVLESADSRATEEPASLQRSEQNWPDKTAARNNVAEHA